MWKYYAILSAVFAAFTAILAKIGIKGVNSNLATAIRTTVILLITWGIAMMSTNIVNGVKDLNGKNWLFLILSGIATGLSWLCYFKALQLGDASRVAPVDKLSVVFVIILSALILHEPLTPRVIIGGLLICAGTIVMIWN